MVRNEEGSQHRCGSDSAQEMARFAKTDIVFGAVTCVSCVLLVLFHLQGKPGILGALIALPLFAPWFFFAVSLCRAFQDGIASGERHVRECTTGSPWLPFGKLMGGRMCLWLPLWVIFLIVLQPWRFDFGLVLFISIAGLIAGTVAACFVWAPLCRKVWTLAVASLLTLGAFCVLLLLLSTLVIEALDLGGYMGLGHMFYAPMMTSGCLFVAAIAAGVWAWWRGAEWFRLDKDVATVGDARAQRFRAQGTLYFLIAGAVLVAVPAGLHELLRSLLLEPNFALGQGKLEKWPPEFLDELFLAPPYSTSYQPGWILPILPGLLLAVAAWALWKRRCWGRDLAIAFHGQAAIISFCVTIWSVIRWLTVDGDAKGFSATANDWLAMTGSAAFGVLVASIVGLVWLCRPVGGAEFGATRWGRIGTLLMCCFAVTIVALAIEFAYNRINVYRGEATYQGQSTGEWLTRLASRDTATRQSAMRELGDSPNSVPVLREIYQGFPLDKANHIYYPDAVERVYWSRFHWAYFRELRKRNLIGKPLVTAITDLAQSSDPDIHEAGRRTMVHLIAHTSEQDLDFYLNQVERLTAIPEADRTAANWGYLGQVLYRIGRLDESRQALEASIRLHGDEHPTLGTGPRWWYLVMVLACLGETETATAHYEQLVHYMKENSSQKAQLHEKLRAQAARLLEIDIPKDP